MNKVGILIRNALIIIWLVVALFVTICLLSYNEFKVTEFGNTSLLIMDSDEMEPEYLEGDLLIVKRNSDNKIDVGDKVFYYNSAMDSSVLVYHGNIEAKKQVSHNEVTYTIDGNKVSSKYIVGKTDSVKVYHSVGKILGVLTSKWGFMFIVIFPTLFAVIYEILMIVETARAKDDDEE